MRKTLNDFIREALLSKEFEFGYSHKNEFGFETCKEIIGKAFLKYVTQEHDQTVRNLNGIQSRFSE